MLLILRPGLRRSQRLRLIETVMAAVEADVRKGADGGGCVFVARLAKRGDSVM